MQVYHGSRPVARHGAVQLSSPTKARREARPSRGQDKASALASWASSGGGGEIRGDTLLFLQIRGPLCGRS